MIKVELEFKDIEELKLLAKGMSAALHLYGRDCYARTLGLECNELITEKLTEEEQLESFRQLIKLCSLLERR